MGASLWTYRARYQALKLRGRWRWRLVAVALVIAVLITAVLVVVPALSTDATSENATCLASHWWKIVVGGAVFLVGLMGNLTANKLQRSLDSLPRDALTANRNHHLADLVGESVRVLLLLLVDSQPPPPGMSKEDFQQSVTDPAKGPLADMAAAAPEFWRGLVLATDPAKSKAFAALCEPELSAFIIDPEAVAMDAGSWDRFLNELHIFARNKTGRSGVPFGNPADRNATTAMLSTQFGRSFRETLKWDATHDGPGWAAMQLRVAGQLLSRAEGAAALSPEIGNALASLRDAYDEGFAVVRQQLTDMESANTRRHREMMSRLDHQHTRIMIALKGLSVQIAGVQQGVDDIQNSLKKLGGRVRPDAPPNTVPTPSRTFIRRRNITAKIHAALQTDPEQVVVRQAVTRAMGGYGKTVAAILYADEYHDHYPGGRFFVPIESGDLTAALASLTPPLGLASANDPKADAALVARTLRDGEPSLLILDNLTSRAAWDAMLASGLVPRGACRVLVTTRDDKVAAKNDIAIGRLEPDEAREIYRLFCEGRNTGATHPPALPEPEIADAITAWVGGLAVAVAAVAAYMKLNPDVSWREHWLGDGGNLRGLKDTRLDELPDVLPEVAAMLGLDGKALEDHRRTLRVIDDAIESLPAPERRAVEYAALLPPDMAPAVWLEQLIEADAARPDPELGDPPDLLKLTLSPNSLSKASPARSVLAHLTALDILLPGAMDGRLLSLHRLWYTRIRERVQTKNDSSVELLDSVEILIYSISISWTSPIDAPVPWSEVIALHALSEMFAQSGRSTARTAARAAIRNIIPSLPSPHEAVQSQAVAVAKAVGRQVK